MDSGLQPLRGAAGPAADTLAVGPLLDYGMRLYRRHFGTFMIASGIWSPPILATTLLGPSYLNNPAAFAGLPLPLRALALPALRLAPALLSLALIYVLSRIAAAADAGSEVDWSMAWRIRPSRIAGMALLTAIYLVGALAMAFCVCSLLVRLLQTPPMPGDTHLDALWMVGIIGSYGVVFLGIAVLGAGLCYAYQPLVQDNGPMLRALSAGFSILRAHVGENIRLLPAAALTAGGFGMAIASNMLALTVIPMAILALSDPLAGTVALAVLLLSYLVALPPLLIWMAVTYRRRHVDDERAAALERRIARMLAAAPTAGRQER